MWRTDCGGNCTTTWIYRGRGDIKSKSQKVKKPKSPKVQVDVSDNENSEVEVVVNDLNAIARWIDALFDQNPKGWWVHATTIDDVVNSIECD